MTEKLTPPPGEFQPVPYDKIASYVPEIEHVQRRIHVMALRCKDRTAIIRRRLRETDVWWIDGTAPLEILLRTPAPRSIPSIANYLYAHLNLATTGDRTGTEQFRYYGMRVSVEEFNRRFPTEAAEVFDDARFNTVSVVILERVRGEQERVDPILSLRPGGIEQHEGRDSPNPVVSHFIDKNPAIAWFVERLARLGFPPPPLSS